MAFPKKRGLRQITIDNIVYRWRFAGGELRGALAIYGPNSSDRILVVKSYEWFDLWLNFPCSLKTAPEAVTPAIVHRAIEFALANGWEPGVRGKDLTFWYCDSKFQANEPDAESIRELRQSQFKTA